MSGNKVRCYNEIDAVGECVTADGSKTRVHACVPMVSYDIICYCIILMSSLHHHRGVDHMAVGCHVEHSLQRRRVILK